MAGPAFRSLSNTTYASRINSAVTLPTGTTDGDILLATLTTAVAASGTVVVTPPAGYTLIDGTDVKDAGNFRGITSLYWKRAATEGGTITFTHATASAQLTVAAVSDCIATGSPVDVYSKNSVTAPTTNGIIAVALGVTTTVYETLLFYIHQNWVGLGTLTPPAGMTERFDGLHYWASEARPTTGATGDRQNDTGNSGGGVKPWAAFLVALKPVVVGGGGGGGGPTMRPVVTVASGGLPVVDVTMTSPAAGLPVTEAPSGVGIAVTKVTEGGVPVTFVTG